MWSSHSTPRRMDNMRSHKNSYTNVHYDTIHSSPSTNWLMDQENVVYPYNDPGARPLSAPLQLQGCCRMWWLSGSTPCSLLKTSERLSREQPWDSLPTPPWKVARQHTQDTVLGEAAPRQEGLRSDGIWEKGETEPDLPTEQTTSVSTLKSQDSLQVASRWREGGAGELRRRKTERRE